MKEIKSDERGIVFQADGFKIFYRKKGSISGDNEKNPREVIYLLQGDAEVTKGGDTKTVSSPAKFVFLQSIITRLRQSRMLLSWCLRMILKF